HCHRENGRVHVVGSRLVRDALAELCLAGPRRPASFAAGISNMPHSTSAASIDLNAVKAVIAAHLGVPVDVQQLDSNRDLYAAGLTSLATVGLMLALEERFDIEFPESMLSRSTFRSVAAIADAVAKLAR